MVVEHVQIHLLKIKKDCEDEGETWTFTIDGDDGSNGYWSNIGICRNSTTGDIVTEYSNKKNSCEQNGFTFEETPSGYCAICSEGYYGENCDITCTDDGTYINSKEIGCYGRGICNQYGICDCKENDTDGFWSGNYCNECKDSYFPEPICSEPSITNRIECEKHKTILLESDATTFTTDTGTSINTLIITLNDELDPLPFDNSTQYNLVIDSNKIGIVTYTNLTSDSTYQYTFTITLDSGHDLPSNKLVSIQKNNIWFIPENACTRTCFCSGNGTCNDDGSCNCELGYSGGDCSLCAVDQDGKGSFYPDAQGKCTIYCRDDTTLSNLQDTYSDWLSKDVNNKVIACNNNGTCNSKTKKCVCNISDDSSDSDNQCITCGTDYYPQETSNDIQKNFCSIKNESECNLENEKNNGLCIYNSTYSVCEYKIPYCKCYQTIWM